MVCVDRDRDIPLPIVQLNRWVLVVGVVGGLILRQPLLTTALFLEAAPIGGQPFAQDISRRDCTAFLLLFDTYDTRLLAQALSRTIRCVVWATREPHLPGRQAPLGETKRQGAKWRRSRRPPVDAL